MMNQTNIVGSNNNNKFYVVQLLESDADPSNLYLFSVERYLLYTRWGRVGVIGQNAAIPATKEQCVRDYHKKVNEKSVKGDYRILERDFAPVQDPEVLKKREEDAFGKSKLNLSVKELIKLIFDLKMMNRAMME